MLYSSCAPASSMTFCIMLSCSIASDPSIPVVANREPRTPFLALSSKNSLCAFFLALYMKLRCSCRATRSCNFLAAGPFIPLSTMRWATRSAASSAAFLAPCVVAPDFAALCPASIAACLTNCLPPCVIPKDAALPKPPVSKPM